MKGDAQAEQLVMVQAVHLGKSVEQTVQVPLLL
jgi:hypothetical protein